MTADGPGLMVGRPRRSNRRSRGGQGPPYRASLLCRSRLMAARASRPELGHLAPRLPERAGLQTRQARVRSVALPKRAPAELLAPQRKDCRDNIQRLGVGWRRGSYLGLDGRDHAPAHLLAADVQVHVPVHLQVVFGIPDGLVRQPRHIHLPRPGDKICRDAAGWALRRVLLRFPAPELGHWLTPCLPYRSSARASGSGRSHPPGQRVEGRANYRPPALPVTADSNCGIYTG